MNSIKINKFLQKEMGKPRKCIETHFDSIYEQKTDTMLRREEEKENTCNF